ncbi:transcriptional repressor [bacterium]|nr:transcriptional repressor [bacterium]
MDKNQYLEEFRKKVKESGLKQSLQRELVVEFFFESKGHVDAETLYMEIKKINPTIGNTTIYRTLRLLCDFNMALSHTFNTITTYFEPIRAEEHHDHLICIKCGIIEEFRDSEIERLQKDVAKKYDFELTHHILQMYGICKKCRKS